MPRWLSSWAVAKPMPLLAPVISAVVVFILASLRRAAVRRERPAQAGIGNTTFAGLPPARDRAGWIHGRADRAAGHPAGGAGRVPARAAVPAAAGRGGAARRRAAAYPGAAPPGSGRAGRDVGGLLHPAGAGPRAAPVGADPGRAGPGADADPGRAGLPVPDGRGEPTA